ncbi:hypothetical protein C8R46DRAFT_1207408 [Mycena filopes]|nr:hypothetical protein C8R46DRAFT_1207408 [Mycena filopes]
MGAYDRGFGAGLIATWLSSLLCGIALTQAVRYFAQFPNDILFKKVLVIVAGFLILLALVGDCAETYMRVVTDWGSPRAFISEIWPPVVYILCNALVAVIVNQFLIYRFYVVSKKLWVAISLSVLDLLSTITGLLLLRFVGETVAKTHTLGEIKKPMVLLTLWTSTSAATDLAIAISLVWTLRGMKTSFKGTSQIIQHIMTISIQNGCTTSACSLAGMISNLLAPNSSIDDLFFLLMGPLYFLTLLSNLTLRTSTATSTSRGWSSYPPDVGNMTRGVPPDSGASNDCGASATEGYDDSTVRGTSDDVEAARSANESVYIPGSPEKIHFGSN